MATNKQWKDWEREMKKWLSEITVWQKNNPDRDWATALFGVETNSSDGGDRPKDPPPKP